MRGNVITRDEMLAIPAYEIINLNLMSPDPLVSVLIVTYNHEAYIEQTLEGILAQQCDFPIEIIIGEDKSNDQTLEICLDYQKRYPQLVRIVTWHKNVGFNANFLRVWARARGKYLAYCEGDDYWIDPTKLTKQVALMEHFPDTVVCGAQTQVLIMGEEGKCKYIPPVNMKQQLFLEEILHSSNSFHTSTFLFRMADFNIPACARSGIFLDNILLVAAALQGSLKCIPDTVSVWRIHTGGMYSGLDNIKKYENALEFLQSTMTFVDEIYLPTIKKREDVIRSFLCHELAAKGQLPRARNLAWETVWRLALHAPRKTLVLIFRVCFPRTFKLVFDAWIRHKQRYGAVKSESAL
jgi:glycosyltransferase involved in cell wall biosynthesis